jgi:hypothetical protein
MSLTLTVNVEQHLTLLATCLLFLWGGGGKWNVLFESQTLKNVYIISANAGSLDLEIITTLEAMGTQLFLDI